MPTLIVDYHPARLSDESLNFLQAFAFCYWAKAPRFADWLVAFVQAEQLRRVGAPHGHVLEPKLATIPWDLPRRDLAQSLQAITVLSYGTLDDNLYSAGQFVDRAVLAISRLTASRLCEGVKA